MGMCVTLKHKKKTLSVLIVVVVLIVMVQGEETERTSSAVCTDLQVSVARRRSNVVCI